MKVLLNISLFVCVISVYSQTSTQNYIKVQTLRQPKLNGSLFQVNKDATSQSIQYFDGLGRPNQSIIRWGSASGYDLISMIDYDAYGREEKSYLPYQKSQTNGYYDTNSINNQNSFYDNKFGGINGNFAFSQNRYDESPLGRVIEQGAPGQDWQLGANTVNTSYDVNQAFEVIHWDHTDLVNMSGVFYNAGELTKTTTTDEDGNITVIFQNAGGQTVLKRVKAGTNEWADTYYVHDDFDQLVVILQPEAIKRINDDLEIVDLNNYTLKYQDYTADNNDDGTKIAYINSMVTIPAGVTLGPGSEITGVDVTLSAQTINDFAFKYTYDDRGRLVEKKVPGADPIYMIYDKWDRLALTQDGNQRQQNEWLFTSYDYLNRPVITGILTQNKTRSQMQALVGPVGSGNTNRYLKFISSGSNHGYNQNSYPFSNASGAVIDEILTITYYDSYDFVSTSELSGTSFQEVFTTSDDWHILPDDIVKPRGQITGTKIREEGNDFITSITYYDNKYRPIQIVSENHLDGTDITSFQYDFGGNIRKSQTEHSVTGYSSTVKRRFTYDHLDRLEYVFHEVDDNGEVLLAHHEYSDIGELEKKNLFEKASPLYQGNYEQTLDYEYNMRGWLTRINDASLSDTQDLFGLELFYNESSGLSGQINRYNGNIVAMKWSNQDIGGDEIDSRAYTFGYDKMNRLSAANHFQNNISTNKFGVSGLSYDLNGNIIGLKRRGESNSAYMDNLSYAYSGNQLTKVDDSGDDSEGFTESGSGTDYTYDASGNMKSDANKGITNIDYNHLNLPTTVTMSGSGNQIEYLYDAAGIKLQQKVYEGGSLMKTTDYVGEFIYEDGELQLIQHEEGRLTPHTEGSGGEFDYQYHLKDHLGNVRVTFSTTPVNYTRVATFEDSNLATESVEFGNVDTPNRVSHPSLSNSGKAARLNNGSPAGPFAVISINKGDTLNLSAKGYYAGGSGYSNAINPATFETALGDAFKTSQSLVEGGVLPTQIESGVAAAIAALGVGGSNNDNIPGAYLNYLVFDRDMNYQNIAGFVQIGSAANGSEQTIALNNIVADREGYIIVYLSNESNTSNYVYFDDLTIYHGKTNIVSTQDYYPFGLTFNESVRTASTAQGFKFNSKERQTDFNLNWDFFGARVHMPEIGRFMSIDPKAEQYGAQSPYVYAANNPIRYSEFNGMNPEDEVKKQSAISSMDANGGTYVSQTTMTTSTSHNEDTGETTTTTTTSVTTNFVTTNEDGEVETTHFETLSATNTSVTDSEGNVTTTNGEWKGTGSTSKGNSEFGALNKWTSHIGNFNANNESTFNQTLKSEGHFGALSSLSGPLVTGIAAGLTTLYAAGESFTMPSSYGLSASGGTIGAASASTVGQINNPSNVYVHGISQSKNGVPLKIMKTPDSKGNRYVGPSSFGELKDSIINFFGGN